MSIKEWEQIKQWMKKAESQAALIDQLLARVQALEARRGPGRPPKEAEAA